MANYPLVDEGGGAGSANVVTPLWVSGAYYSAGIAGVSSPELVISPIDYQPYIRIVSGVGSTDPSLDTTNWKPSAARAIKSIQRGTISLTSVTTATATVTAVVTAKSLLSFLGFNTANLTNDYNPSIVLTNSTTITATRVSNGAPNTTVSWELVERY